VFQSGLSLSHSGRAIEGPLDRVLASIDNVYRQRDSVKGIGPISVEVQRVIKPGAFRDLARRQML
jgi:hypothetical protein